MATAENKLDAADIASRVLYEDNHIIVVNKLCGEPVQGDSSGDLPLLEKVREFIKKRDRKPGNVFLGLPHRLDRPTSGIVVLAKTDKVLSRLGKIFKGREVRKTYWAVLDHMPPEEKGSLHNFLSKNRKLNKSFVVPSEHVEKKGAKEAVLNYRLIAATTNYYLVEVELETGRHHQIRAQFAAVGCHIKGDLKYGAGRSNPDGGIHLHARSLSFVHPVSKQKLEVCADPPEDPLWKLFSIRC
jgi:23S rRNA pseudouridine1911/1915/1917 synthase